MRKLLHWLGHAIAAQPFYADEIGMLRLTVETLRESLPHLGRFLPD